MIHQHNIIMSDSQEARYNGFTEYVGQLILESNLNHAFSVYSSDLDELPEFFSRGELLASNISYNEHEFLRKYEDGLMCILHSKNSRRLDVRGCFPTHEAASRIYQEALTHVPKIIRPDDIIPINFWNWSDKYGPRINTRSITVPSWDDICMNYTPELRLSLDNMMKMKDPETESGGKLLLWRGVAGSGKTFSLRALCREWKEWCTVHYIIDPDVFFTRAEYMIGVLTNLGSNNNGGVPLGSDDDDPDIFGESNKKQKSRYNLLLLEDAGELIVTNARDRVGQALSKLLNLTDGLLGQGIKLLVMITTNEDSDKLHEAIGREGRCMSNLQFDSFDDIAAMEWLKLHGHNVDQVPEKKTLADLYAIVNDKKSISHVKEKKKVGFMN